MESSLDFHKHTYVTRTQIKKENAVRQLCNGIPYSKEQELQIHTRTWTNLKNFTLSKRCQTQRSQNCNSIYMTFKNKWQKYRIVVTPWGQWLGRAGESLWGAKKCSLSWFSGGCFHGSVWMLTQLCPGLCNPMNLAHQAPLSMGLPRQESWVAISSSGGSSQPGDWTWVSCIGR